MNEDHKKIVEFILAENKNVLAQMEVDFYRYGQSFCRITDEGFERIDPADIVKFLEPDCKVPKE